MKKPSISNFKFQISNSFFKVLLSLKEWCDPACEGNPYTDGQNVKTGLKPVSVSGFKPDSTWSNRVGFRQRLMLRRV